MSRAGRFVVSIVGSIALVVSVGAWIYFHGQQLRLPYHDDFANGKTEEWQAFGGAWETAEGGIRNNSDERGAKLIAGSPSWTDYTVESDVMLLGREGDAGIVVRSSDEEEGVDAYSGYYVGLRDRNNTIAIGRADHGWMEYQMGTVPSGIHPFQWYHLKVVAYGCKIAALTVNPGTGESTPLAMQEEHCVRAGRIGLRSYSSGGIWKNIRVSRVSPNDVMWLAAVDTSNNAPNVIQSESGFNSLLAKMGGTHPDSNTQLDHPSEPSTFLPLGSIRLQLELDPPLVNVKGSVVLTDPKLFIQDSTGGTEVEAVDSPALKIGDEVEVTGRVEHHKFGAVLRDATVRPLWSRSPIPPLSVTAAQAASGSFDGMFLEIEGYLHEVSQVADNRIVLTLKSGSQTFRAIADVKNRSSVPKLRANSLLRLRGVAVVDPNYTENLTAFVLLLRSSERVEVVSGPPWWDKRHLLAISIGIVLAMFVGFWLYTRAVHWKLRAVMEERSRMAREIHDTLAQGFAGIALQLESVIRELRPHKDHASGQLTMALQMARQSRGEAHRSIAALRTLHTEAPLADMLEKVLKQQAAGSGVQLTVTVTGEPRRLTEEKEGHILRIAQESLANITQHAHARHVDVNLKFDDTQLSMEIIDDGLGFDVAEAPTAEEGHFGIKGMEERAARIQGIFFIESKPGATTVCLKVPMTSGRDSHWRQVSRFAARLFGRQSAFDLKTYVHENPHLNR